MNELTQYLEQSEQRLSEMRGYRITGYVDEILGVMISARLRHVRIGEICRIESGHHSLCAEVVAFRQSKCLLMPYGSTLGLRTDAVVMPTGKALQVQCSSRLLGRVLNGLGDGEGVGLGSMAGVGKCVFRDIHSTPPDPMKRNMISEPFLTGIPSVDGFLTIGKGQRMGVFAAAGTGKSTLLSQIARHASADVFVINLIGERGREVREFVDESLGEKGLSRSVVVAATSDQPAIIRLKSAFVATTMAEYFRDLGMNVVLLMDSVTRFARALREIGLARGEAPARAGYPPSVFAELPRLLERTGAAEKGSITALYTVLVAGDDMADPVADEVMSILDGHIVLSRKLAHENCYPAIDIMQSKSRVMKRITSEKHQLLASELLSRHAQYCSSEDALRFGFYEPGKDTSLDSAVKTKPHLDRFLFQNKGMPLSLDDVIQEMETIQESGQMVS